MRKRRETQDARAAQLLRKKKASHWEQSFPGYRRWAGRLSAAYHVYLRAWSEGLKHAGFLPGYCSGIPVHMRPRVTILPRTTFGATRITNDLLLDLQRCLSAVHGCAFPRDPPAPSASGISGASIWQFAQSPARKEFTAHCPAKYAPDGNCYAPGTRPKVFST